MCAGVHSWKEATTTEREAQAAGSRELPALLSHPTVWPWPPARLDLHLWHWLSEQQGRALAECRVRPLPVRALGAQLQLAMLLLVWNDPPGQLDPHPRSVPHWTQGYARQVRPQCLFFLVLNDVQGMWRLDWCRSSFMLPASPSDGNFLTHGYQNETENVCSSVANFIS